MTVKHSKSVWRKRFIALRQRFVLTAEEKKVVAFVLLALFLGLATKRYRDAHPLAPPAIDKKHPSRSYHLPSTVPPRADARH